MADGDAPRVGIVVIALNERDNAPRCIDSILAQDTDETFEVVVVDDGSTDGTADVALAAAAGDPRVRVVRLPENRGRGAARGAGVAATDAPLVAFVDADISLPPDWLRRCLVELPGHAAVGGIAVPDGHTAVLARITGARPRELPGSMPITGANVLFDGAVLRRYGIDPADRLGEDFRLVARLLEAGERLGRVPGLVVRHEERKPYARELRWRFDNGVDAATHVRDVGPRFPDLVWLGWLGAWVTAIAGAIAASPWWLALGVAASVAVGLVHAASRFHPTPVVPFGAACLADVPLMNANMLGRTIGLPRLLRPRGPRTAE